MTDEFEQALRRALRPKGPGEDLSGAVVSRLDPGAVPAVPVAHLPFIRLRASRFGWWPVALAACLIAGIGLVQVRRHDLEAARANQARAELLRALSIASDNINVVRVAVAREENPDS